jgi:hypothetical protein
MTVCMRCHTCAPTRPYGSGLLWLCEHCVLQTPVCREYEHTFRASTTTGVWVCVMCGVKLESQAITTTPVMADTPAPHCDC